MLAYYNKYKYVLPLDGILSSPLNSRCRSTFYVIKVAGTVYSTSQNWKFGGSL